MNRRPSTQDLTWLLDLSKNKQLDLDPPYQRRSVWTLKDKQFFLDTIFRNYPSPAIFLHKTVDDAGKATYHVVDGKQRTQTILDFVADKVKIGKDYGDARLDGKKWSELVGDVDLKQRFWNYQITIEQIDFVEGTVVNEVFDRLNRNARRLTPQELRHAKFEGWLISTVEAEASQEEWQKLGVVTKARAKRMMDAQFISELFLVILEGKALGFDQNALDEMYAKYEDVGETVPELNEDQFLDRVEQVKAVLMQMEDTNNAVTQHAKGFGNFYTLWAFLALTPGLPAPADVAARYVAFMERVAELAAQEDLQAFLEAHPGPGYARAFTYLENTRGASTDLAQRAARLEALRAGVVG
jgi:hypothetical protein